MIYLVYLIYLVYEWGTTKDNKWTRKTLLLFSYPVHQLPDGLGIKWWSWFKIQAVCWEILGENVERPEITSLRWRTMIFLRPASNIHRWHASVTNQKLASRKTGQPWVEVACSLLGIPSQFCLVNQLLSWTQWTCALGQKCSHHHEHHDFFHDCRS